MTRTVVRPMILPPVLPHPEAIKSFNDNSHGYEPEFWEFQYEVYRYLEGLPDTELANRYLHIMRNMNALVAPERHVIPIQSMLSSWYWYRKEHQTRYEFALRKVRLPREAPNEIVENHHIGAPAHPRHPNAGDVLFRYGDLGWTPRAIREGTFRITAAYHYRELERTDDARWDDELNKHSFLPRRYLRITTRNGQEIRPNGDVKRTASSPNYFVLCMSCEWESDLFSAFSANSCLVIRKPEQLANLLGAGAKEELDGWLFHDGPVHYFDPYEWKANAPFDAALCKDFRFAYQREYRFIWVPPPGQCATGYKELEVGSLSESAELYDAHGTRLL